METQIECGKGLLEELMSPSSDHMDTHQCTRVRFVQECPAVVVEALTDWAHQCNDFGCCFSTTDGVCGQRQKATAYLRHIPQRPGRPFTPSPQEQEFL
ncbi:unnamed protein product [Boreogadus saida]